MALKAFRNILISIKQNPLEKAVRLFLSLALITASLGALFLMTTDYSIVGIVLLFFLILPLLVTNIEFNSILETDPRLPNLPAVATQFFRKSFRSTRMVILLSFRTLLWVLLVNGVVFLLTMIGLSIFITNFDAAALQVINDFSNLMLNGTGTTAIYDFIDANVVILHPYLLTFSAITQISFFISLLYFVFFNVIKVYVDIFIQKRPGVRPNVVYKKLFGGRKEQKFVKRTYFISVLIPFLLFIITYTAGIYIFKNRVSDPYNYDLIIARSQILAFLVFAVFIPYIFRATYFIFKQLSDRKKEEVLVFTIEELTFILKMPELPDAHRKFFELAKRVREAELEALKKETDDGVIKEQFPDHQ